MVSASRKLQQALLELLADNDFPELSVIQICQVAHVHPSTFYAHYANQLELLEANDRYLTAYFHEKFDKIHHTYKVTTTTNFTDPAYLRPYLEFIASDQELYLIYLKNKQFFFDLERFDKLIANHFAARFETLGINDPQQIDYMVHFYLAEIEQIIYLLQNRCREPVTFILELIQTCLRGNFKTS